MSANNQDDDNREALAAELALGILDSDAQRAAEDLAARDPAFAAAVERWRADIAPLAETATPVEPPSELWQRIEAMIAPVTGPARRRQNLWSSLAFWRGFALAATAAAAMFAALLLLPPPSTSPLPRESQMAAAPVVMDSGTTLVAAAYDPAQRRVIVTPTHVLPLPSAQSMELWIIVGDKPPRSLGVIDAASPRAYRLPANVRADLATGAALAITLEPRGGSPSGAPTGPIVAQGKLTKI